MARQSGPKPDALPGCATPRHPEAPSFSGLSGQAESSVRGDEWQNEAGTGEQTPELSQNRTFEKALTANPDVSGVSGDAVGETPSNPANGLGVDGGTDGRCPNCGEDEVDGAKCYYCGWHDYNCGLCDECRSTPPEAS